MSADHLLSQINTIYVDLIEAFEDIGVPEDQQDNKLQEIFDAACAELESHVARVNEEKAYIEQRSTNLISAIRKLDTALDTDPALLRSRQIDLSDNALSVRYPLLRCYRELRATYLRLLKIRRERLVEVKKIVESIETYSSRIDPSFLKVVLPPFTTEISDSYPEDFGDDFSEDVERLVDDGIPIDFDLSSFYIRSLEIEYSNVYEEYHRRVALVAEIGQEIQRLWAELSLVPDANELYDTTANIVNYAQDAPEKMGLYTKDIKQMERIRDDLHRTCSERVVELNALREEVYSLWDKLRVDDEMRAEFLKENAGITSKDIGQFEDELERLHQMKKEHLNVFVEDARCRLQELWDGLFFSEEEMLEFTPAFSDAYSDALLEAHEAEIARLEVIKEDRQHLLNMVAKHLALIHDRDELLASSQDASRLMARGVGGQRRDPTRLLREEKMRKRVTTQLPRVESELRRSLLEWEQEKGEPFLVHGDRYVDQLTYADSAMYDNGHRAPPSAAKNRAKTPMGYHTPGRSVFATATPGHTSMEDVTFHSGF